jgi:N-acetylglucosaminyldiphosphoundecaprenol N-acetyl-beta-D-mannosaminyltransferase
MIPFFDYEIRTALPKELPVQQIVIDTINPHSFCVAEKDADFKSALQSSDILIPDGEGIVWGVKKTSGKQIKKIAGFDLHQHCLELLKKQGGGKVFYLGAAQGTLDKIEERIKKEYPTLEVGSYSPPYKPSFSEEDNKIMIEQVNAFSPDVLFVGMTAPKQEKWIHQNHKQLDAKIICAIGAVFDFYAGTVKRPSDFWVKLKLEWLVRFLKEPKRLFRRNFVSTPMFVWHVFTKK